MGLVHSDTGARAIGAKPGLVKTAQPKPPARKTVKAADPSAPKRARKSSLEVLRLQDPRHALLCPPADFIDCRHPIEEVGDHLISPDSALFRLTYSGTMRGYSPDKKVIWTMPSDRVPHPGALSWPQIKQTRRTEIDLHDAHGHAVVLTLFHAPRTWAERTKGQSLLLLGRLERWGRNLCMAVDKEAPEAAAGTIWAQYAGIPGQIAGDRIAALVQGSLGDEMAYRACMATILGETGLTDQAVMEACGSDEHHGFSSCIDVLKALHTPSSIDEGRLALEYAKRITALGIQASALRHHTRSPHPKAPLPVDKKDAIEIMAALPMPLTKSQQEVASCVIERLSQPTPMNGLLSGDVGTGKTLAFLVPSIAAHRAGVRVAIITPRTLLADQIADEIIKRFDGLVGDVERVPTGGKIKNPLAILVGTSGLATIAAKQGYAPNLLICDEQHKFSAEAREALVAPYTHVLEVSATPVPRSLAAALYEGMEILNLRECPVKKTIHSEVIDMKERGRVIAGIKNTLKTGGVAAMIYPMVTTAEGSEGQSVTKAFESLNAAFPGQAVMLHGDMPDELMRQNIAMLRSGEKRLVVASTVLEIGIDIPSVNFMAVRDSDRFGISQLHQLRGRLVRNGGEGQFFMVVEDLELTPEATLERLHAVASTTDGYKLAEMDLVQRGFGDLDGSAQSGNSNTIFRNIKLDVNDFLARKLKSLHVETGRRDYNKAENLALPAQARIEGMGF